MTQQMESSLHKANRSLLNTRLKRLRKLTNLLITYQITISKIKISRMAVKIMMALSSKRDSQSTICRMNLWIKIKRSA